MSAHQVVNRETPTWFDDVKLGIFIHWSAAAIPAFAPKVLLDDLPDDRDWAKSWRRLPFAEMYENTLAVPDSPTARYHAEKYGDRPYAEFVEQFRTEMIPRWDPDPWAELFAQAGAGYVVFTTKIEDGFLFWPSSHPNPRRDRWQSERDVVGELAEAVRARGVRFGTYYCSGVDWSFGGLPITGGRSLLKAMSQDADYTVMTDAHWRELIDRYAPCVLWNDYGRPESLDVDALFRAYIERVPDGLINDRFDNEVLRCALESRGREEPVGRRPDAPAVYSDFVTVEYAIEGPPDRKWEANRGMGTSFGYNAEESDDDYMSSAELIHLFVDIVARGGNLLINVGPTATGEIPWPQAERLMALGRWLQLNGTAVRSTATWDRAVGITGDGLRVRYTASEDAVHAIILGSPVTDSLVVDVRLDSGAEVTLEGRRGLLSWEDAPGGTRIRLPERLDQGPAPAVRLSPRSSVRPFEERP